MSGPSRFRRVVVLSRHGGLADHDEHPKLAPRARSALTAKHTYFRQVLGEKFPCGGSATRPRPDAIFALCAYSWYNHVPAACPKPSPSKPQITKKYWKCVCLEVSSEGPDGARVGGRFMAPVRRLKLGWWRFGAEVGRPGGVSLGVARGGGLPVEPMGFFQKV